MFSSVPSGSSEAHACTVLGHRLDVADLHHAFDLFVQSSEYEGTPNAVLEAMAMNTPIVATDVGGTRELVTDGVHGLLVQAGSAPALADKILAALNDRDAATRRADAARQRIETELSFERRVQKVEAVYQELIRPIRAAGSASRRAAS